MKKMMGPNCREVTTLVLRAEETPLRWRERMAVRMHMFICRACPRFAEQLALMRKATARWRKYSED